MCEISVRGPRNPTWRGDGSARGRQSRRRSRSGGVRSRQHRALTGNGATRSRPASSSRASRGRARRSVRGARPSHVSLGHQRRPLATKSSASEPDARPSPVTTLIDESRASRPGRRGGPGGEGPWTRSCGSRSLRWPSWRSVCSWRRTGHRRLRAGLSSCTGRMSRSPTTNACRGVPRAGGSRTPEGSPELRLSCRRHGCSVSTWCTQQDRALAVPHGEHADGPAACSDRV